MTPFSEVEHRRINPVTMHALTNLFYILQYIKHPFTSYLAAKHLKHSKLWVANIREYSVVLNGGLL